MRVLFVLNPAAGHGRAAGRWRAAFPPFSGRPADCVVRETQGPGHAAELARQGLEQGFEAVVAVGGDGTVGEVAHGYLSAPEELRARAALGTWPVGSGCDLARHLGLRPEPEELLRALAGRRVVRLDAGRADFSGYDGKPRTLHFLNMAAFGLAGEVALRVRSAGKPWGGCLSYMFSSLGALLEARPRRMELTLDGETLPERGYHLVVLANTSTFGGGMRVAPQADPQDGRLDMVSVGGLSRWELLRRFPSIYSGGHLGAPGVEFRRARRVLARSPETVHLNVDGEAAGTLPASFEILPGAVPFLRA